VWHCEHGNVSGFSGGGDAWISASAFFGAGAAGFAGGSDAAAGDATETPSAMTAAARRRDLIQRIFPPLRPGN
jgi:hypothetical protein